MTPKSNLKNRTNLKKNYLKDTDDLKMKTTFKLKCQIRWIYWGSQVCVCVCVCIYMCMCVCVCAWLCLNFVHIFFKYILARICLPQSGSKWFSKIWIWAWTLFGPVWTSFGPGSRFLWTVFGPDWTRFGPGSRFVFINPTKNVA